MSEDQFFLNGIDGVTGEYLVPPMSAESVARLIRPTRRSRAVRLAEAAREPVHADRSWACRSTSIRPTWRVPAGVSLFPPRPPPKCMSALEPLIAHRRSQVLADRCKILEYRPGENMKDWLKRHGVYAGSVAPTKVPYYLLLIGGPESIPFDFQYLLDIEYAVGRLCFDHADQYRLYAESVVEYEKAQAAPTSRQMVYWGTRHPRDRATEMSADFLITPLHEGMPAAADQPEEKAIADTQGFQLALSQRAGSNPGQPRVRCCARPRVRAGPRSCSRPRTAWAGPRGIRTSGRRREHSSARIGPGSARFAPAIT